MYIGKVIGSVVATVKVSHLEGRTLLLVDQLDLGGKETGAYPPARSFPELTWSEETIEAWPRGA